MENGKTSSPLKMNKKFIIIAVVAVVVVGAIVALMMMNQGANTNSNNNGANNAPVAGDEMNPEAGMPGEENVPMAGEDSAIQEIIKDAVAPVPGASLVTKDNKVITAEGVIAQNDAVPASPNAPKQSPVIDAATLGSSVIKLNVSAAGFAPNSFEVKAGAPVSLAVTADAQTHVFFFDDPKLGAVAIGVDPGTTRAITFNAPTEKGEYAFHCDVPGHRQRGEEGKMIVK